MKNKEFMSIQETSNNFSLLKNIFFTNTLIFLLFTIIGFKNSNFNKIDYNEYINEKDAKMILESKKLGYDILLDTISEYLDHYQDEDFEHFLQIMWPSDYIILQKSKQKIEGYTRDYQEWKDLFYMMIKNK